MYNNIVVVAISVNSSARRHGVSDADVRHAVEHALFSDDIDRLADEAEAGYGDDQLRSRQRGRPSLGSGPARTVQARLGPELFEALQERVQAEHSSQSEVVRAALSQYLAS